MTRRWVGRLFFAHFSRFRGGERGDFPAASADVVSCSTRRNEHQLAQLLRTPCADARDDDSSPCVPYSLVEIVDR